MHNTRKTCLFLLVLALFLLAPSFAMAQGGQISGYAWYDTEGDRTYSEGDRTLGRVTAVLYRSVNGTEEQIGKITTGTDGMYAFTGLAAGEYRLSVVARDSGGSVLPAQLLPARRAAKRAKRRYRRDEPRTAVP